MQPALRITAKVSPDNRLEVELPPGSEGREVDVFIVLPTSSLNTQARYSNLAEMATDPDVQRKIVAVNAEFLAAEMDRLI